MKKILLASALAAGLMFNGCGDDVDPEKDLEHDSVKITELENFIVTYDNNGAAHSYKYCPNGELYYGEDLKTIGTYIVTDKNVVITEATNLTYITDGKFEKGEDYNVTASGHREKVTKIVDTVCGEIK